MVIHNWRGTRDGPDDWLNEITEGGVESGPISTWVDGGDLIETVGTRRGLSRGNVGFKHPNFEIFIKTIREKSAP